MAAVVKNSALASSTDDEADGVWARIARSYAAFGSPFVPCREDVIAFESAVTLQAHQRVSEYFKAVMLGVTPRLALMKWPQGSQIRAIEISQAVIDALWPGNIPGVRNAVCASWFGIPLKSGSCDVVVGDGSLSVCRFPSEARNLVQCVKNLLVDEGIFVFRSYVRPDVQESVDEVFETLLRQGGMSVDCFKMRLYLAMQRSLREGVAVREAARMLDKYGVDLKVMRERLGWSKSATEPFANWPASNAIYSFPTLNELREVIEGVFAEVSVTYPSYELGHCCPTIVVRARPNISGD